MIMKVLKVVLIVFWALLTICVLLIIFARDENYVECRPYSPEYEVWFPYCENDVLYFKSETDSILKFKIVEILKSHRIGYHSDAKCGYCEDSLTLALSNETHKLHFFIQNIDNKHSAFRSYLQINDSMTLDLGDNGEVLSDSLVLGDFILLRNKGIVQISLQNKLWKLSHIKKSNETVEQTQVSCN